MNNRLISDIVIVAMSGRSSEKGGVRADSCCSGSYGDAHGKVTLVQTSKH